MNYVELHIGDYDKATAHLTACEDGIYGRLLRRYYDTEAPLPLELDRLQRFVRARSRDEKAAVETVLGEFFHRTADGWHHKRCDEEIDRYKAKQEKARASANARWNPKKDDANAMRTHSEGNAHQTPDTRHQAKAITSRAETLQPAEDPKAEPRQPEPPRGPQSDAGRACLLMRQAGCVSTNPSHPDLLAALTAGVTPEALGDTVREAIELGKLKPFTWAIATARGRLDETRPPATTGAPRSGTPEPRTSLVDNAAHRAKRILLNSDDERDD